LIFSAKANLICFGMALSPILVGHLGRKIHKDFLLDMHTRHLFIIKRDFGYLVK